MILGVGTDIIEIARIEKVLKRHPERFLLRVFTTREQDYCLRHQYRSRHLAGRFAAKEAVAKALGTGFNADLDWLDIEISNDRRGQPQIALQPAAAARFDHPHLLLSISHCHTYATAVVVWDGSNRVKFSDT